MAKSEAKSGAGVTDRRGFLKLAGLGTVASGAVLVAGKDADASVLEAGKDQASYRETEHVKTFYETARF